MSEAPGTSYDTVPYESHPFSQSHPDRLATVATLLGLQPPPVARCRVLELGCASGGNLIPMAVGLPESTFVGVELSRRQVADGQKVIDALGLKNIELRQMSILDVNADFGRFDYVIAHGVFSWVPTPVQDKILEICARNLAPNGVAYVSYNTYPGWHMRGMIRDIMCYHAEQFTEPLARVKQARILLDFLAKTVEKENTPYSLLLKNELELIRQSRDSYLFHDHLEEVNDPVYFYQFAKRAAAQGLRYLGEVDLRVMVPGNYPPEVENVLQMLSPDLIRMEQYMDFLRNRMFRQTLLCHQHLTPNYALRPEQLTAFHVASPAKPVNGTPDVRSTEFEAFRGPDGVTLNSREPVVKAAMVHLAEVWPQAVPFPALLAVAQERAGLCATAVSAVAGSHTTADTAVARDGEQLAQALLKCYTSASTSLVELHVRPPRFAHEVREQPVASPLARHQAALGNAVTNLRHELVALTPFARHVVRHLDGRRDRAALVDILTGLVDQSELTVQQDGQPVRDAAKVRAYLGQGLDEELPRLASQSLLIG